MECYNWGVSNKIIKLLGIILAGAVLLSPALSPLGAYGPSVLTRSATGVTSTSVILNGFVSASNFQTRAWFEYGTDANFGNLTSVSFDAGYGYNGNYSANVAGLAVNTTYFFRAVAQNPQGRVYGNIYSFTTSPFSINNINNNDYLFLSAITEPASFISSNSVQLNSLVYNEANDSSRAWFEWGPNSNLGNKTTEIETGMFPTVKHAGILTGLAPGTTYYFRAVAENSAWRNNGPILSFVTSGAAFGNNINQNTNSAAPDKEKVPNVNLEQSIGSALGTNVLGAGSFLPVNIFGWLILFILALILLFLVKHLYGQLPDKKLEEKTPSA